jgi:(p)ppGpp synthase/HD superfamily hydrolase
MGYLSTGRGIVIHRNICGNLGEYRKQPEKWITVDWEPNIDREFSADILIEVTNRPGVLADVASTIGDTESNIEQVSIDERHEDSADLLFSILVRDRVHLASVLRNIRHIPMVNKISRPCT